MNAEPARVALVERRRDIGRWRGRGIERVAVIDDLGDAAIGGNVEPHLDPMRRRHLTKGVSDDIVTASSIASIILKVRSPSTPPSPQHRSTHSISGGIAAMSGATAVSCEAIGPHTVPMGPKPSPISVGSTAHCAEAAVTFVLLLRQLLAC